MTQAPLNFEPLFRALSRAWRRRRTTSALWLYVASAAVVALVLGLLTLTGLLQAEIPPVTMVLVGLGSAAGAFLVHQIVLRLITPGSRRLLQDADATYGLRNLLETAWEKRADSSPFSNMVAVRAADKMGHIEGAKVYPVGAGALWPRLVASLLVWAGALTFSFAAVSPLDVQTADDPGARLIAAARRLRAAAGDESERELASQLEELGNDVSEGRGLEDRGRHLLERVQEQISGLERAPVAGETPGEEFPEGTEDADPQALRTTEEEGDREVMVNPRGRAAADGEQEEVEELDDSDAVNTAEDFLDGTENNTEGRTPPAPGEREGERREALADAEDALRESMENVTGGIGDLELEEGEPGEAGEDPGGRGGGRREQNPEARTEESLSDSGDESGSLGGNTPAEDGMDDDFERLTMPEDRAPFSQLEGDTRDGPILDLLLREPPEAGATQGAEEPPLPPAGAAREAPVDYEAVPAALRSYVRDYFLRVAGTGGADPQIDADSQGGADPRSDEGGAGTDRPEGAPVPETQPSE